MFASKNNTVAFINTICQLQNSNDLGYGEITLDIIAAVWLDVSDYRSLEGVRN